MSLKKTCLIFAFSVDRSKLVVIKKKRGMGAGLLSFPGGKFNEGETLREVATRELFEETGLENFVDYKECGFIRFIFESDGENSKNWSNDCSLVEITVPDSSLALKSLDPEECEPFWSEFQAISWDQCWPDDRNWVPRIWNHEKVFREVFFDKHGSVLKAIDADHSAKI